MPSDNRTLTRSGSQPSTAELAGIRSAGEDLTVVSQEREHPRYAHEVAIQVMFGESATEGRTRNMSRGGLCANVGLAIPLGTEVIVDITLVFDDDLQSEALTLPARVAWCTTVDDEFQVGLSFKPMHSDRAQVLQMFLKYLGEERAGKAPRVEKSIDDQFR